MGRWVCRFEVLRGDGRLLLRGLSSLRVLQQGVGGVGWMIGGWSNDLQIYTALYNVGRSPERHLPCPFSHLLQPFEIPETGTETETGK